MTDFSKLMEKAKEIESKMKESQENIKKIEIKRFPLLETHFFPLCPFPLVWISLVTIPCFMFCLINLIAVSLVLLTPL